MDFTRQGSGPCLVLLPGLGCDRRMWEPVGALLEDRFCLLHPHVWPLAALDEAAGRVADLLDRLGVGQAGVAGLSMGGYLAFEMLRQRPERIRATALADTTAFPDTPERAAKRRQALRLLQEGRFEQVLEAFVGSVLGPAEAGAGRTRDLLFRMARDLGAAAFARATEAILRRGSYEDVLSQLRVPTLFLCGEHDALTPPEVAQRMSKRVPGSKRVIVPGAGHLAPLENPEAVGNALGAFFAAALPCAR